ncbi:MAG: nucleotidyltransferase domain-containing protein [Bacteroidota bacterium]
MRVTIEIDHLKKMERLMQFCEAQEITEVQVSDGKYEKYSRNQMVMQSFKEQLLEKLDSPIHKLILFGSQINGQAHKDSDHDVLLILKNPIEASQRKNILSTASDIDMEFDTFLDVKMLAKEDLETIVGKCPVYQNAFKKRSRNMTSQ